MDPASASQWWERAFGPGGMGWPLLIVVGLGLAAYRFSRWAGPLAEKLIDALIDFLTALGGQLTRIEKTGEETRAAIDDLARELREDRLHRERGQ